MLLCMASKIVAPFVPILGFTENSRRNQRTEKASLCLLHYFLGQTTQTPKDKDLKKNHLWWSLIMWEQRMYTCMCNWVTMLYSRKLIEHCKPAIMEKNHYIHEKYQLSVLDFLFWSYYLQSFIISRFEKLWLFLPWKTIAC